MQQFATFGTTISQKKRPVDVFVGAAHPLGMEELRSCKIAKKTDKGHQNMFVTNLTRSMSDMFFEMHSISSRDFFQLERILLKIVMFVLRPNWRSKSYIETKNE